MIDLPEPVTLEWIARQLVEMQEEISGASARTRTLIEILGRIEANAAALHEEMRAFNEQRAPAPGPYGRRRRLRAH